MISETKVGPGSQVKANTKLLNSDLAQKYNEDAFENFNEKALEPCHICGRTFLPASLKIHLKSCKPKKGEEKK